MNRDHFWLTDRQFARIAPQDLSLALVHRREPLRASHDDAEFVGPRPSSGSREPVGLAFLRLKATPPVRAFLTVEREGCRAAIARRLRHHDLRLRLQSGIFRGQELDGVRPHALGTLLRANRLHDIEGERWLVEQHKRKCSMSRAKAQGRHRDVQPLSRVSDRASGSCTTRSRRQSRQPPG
jgi:hypothetical protein